jgi:hypothetical protein
MLEAGPEFAHATSPQVLIPGWITVAPGRTALNIVTVPLVVSKLSISLRTNGSEAEAGADVFISSTETVCPTPTQNA